MSKQKQTKIKTKYTRIKELAKRRLEIIELHRGYLNNLYYTHIFLNLEHLKNLYKLVI